MGHHNPPPSGPSVLAGTLSFLQSMWDRPQIHPPLKPRLRGKGFHTLINDDLFSSPTNVGHHNPPPSGPSVLAGTFSFLQSMWDRPQIHPPLEPSVLTGTSPRVYPLWGTTRRLAHRPVSGSDTICNGSIHPYQILSSLGFPFRASPQGFKARLLGEGFHTLINGDLFSSPTNVGHHTFDLNFIPYRLVNYKNCEHQEPIRHKIERSCNNL